MSARMEADMISWEEYDLVRGPQKDLSAIRIECLRRNVEPGNLVAPLREAAVAAGSAGSGLERVQEKQRAALALQEQWDSWIEERNRLRDEIKRGRECLEEARKEVASLQLRLEEWAAYERLCGHNPLVEYTQLLAASEQMQQFLPGWIQRREARLAALTKTLQACAKQNGLEHLL